MLCMVLTKKTRTKIITALIGVTLVFIVHTQKSYQPFEPMDIFHLWIGILIVGILCITLLPVE